MFEAYSVAVRVSLINGVSAGLMMMARQFGAANLAASGLQKRLKEIRGLMLVGGGMTAAGLGIFYGLEKAAKPAEEYARALNRLKMAGLSQVEIAQAVGSAWKNTGDVMTTTASGNLSALLDLRNILGSMDLARRDLPVVTKIGAVVASASEGKISSSGGQDLAFSMAKALDIIGAAKDPATFERQAGLMAKSITAFQGRVTPRMFQSVFQYARQAKFDLSDEFKYQFLPTLMLEMSGAGSGGGGGSRGVGPMIAALYRVTNQGYVNKKAVPLLEKLGLISPGSAMGTSTTGTMVAPLKGAALAAQNPFAWSQQVLVPAIKAAYPNATDDQKRAIVNSIFRGNQLAAAAMVEFISKPQNFLRDQRILSGAMNYKDAFNVAMKNDPALSRQAMSAQWNNFLTTTGPQIVSDLISIMRSLAPALHDAAMFFKAHPTAAKLFVRSLETIATLLTVGGVITALTGAAKAFGLLGKVAPALLATSAGGLALAAVPWVIIATGLTAFALSIPTWLKVFEQLPGVVKGRMAADAERDHLAQMARERLDHGSPYVHSGGAGVVHGKTGDVYLDRRKVGEVMGNFFGRAGDVPRLGPDRFDFSRNYAPVGMGPQ